MGIDVSVSNLSGGIVNATGASITAFLTGIQVFGGSTFAGPIVNSGTITSTVAKGIYVAGVVQFGTSSAGGGIVNSGEIGAGPTGIFVYAVSNFAGGIANSGTIGGNEYGVAIEFVSIFGGGISNAGTITGGEFGVYVDGTGTFSGGITNSGQISGGGGGIQILNDGTFLGGITNSGQISGAGFAGIQIENDGTFLGGIVNSAGGTISSSAPGGKGILITNVAVFGSSSAGGGITNAGLISSSDAIAILVYTVTTFVGNITNSGTVSAAQSGVIISAVSTFAGGIGNSGLIVGGLGAWDAIKVTNVGVFGTTGVGGGITNAGLISSPHATAILINNVTTFLGNITNSGTILGTHGGVIINAVSTFAASISNTGLIAAGAGGYDAIKVTGVGTFGVNSAGGGIVNSGTLTGSNGIYVGNVTTFQGGITNTQKITAGSDGIFIGSTGTVSGAIVNSAGATISGALVGIALNSVANLGTTSAAGGISNAGTITGATGIKITGNVVFVGSAAIVNTGNITGTGGTAITAATEASAVVIDQNGGTITGNVLLSSHADVMTIAGGTVVGNIVGAGTTNTLNFALGSGVIYTDSNTFTTINQVDINSGTVLLNNIRHGDQYRCVLRRDTGRHRHARSDFDHSRRRHVRAGRARHLHAGHRQPDAAIGLDLHGHDQRRQCERRGGIRRSRHGDDRKRRASQGQRQRTPIVGTKYTILTATGDVTGTFADPAFFFGRYEGVLSYDLNDVYLTVENGSLLSLLPPGAPINVINVANGIDTAIQNGVTPPPGFANLFNYTPQQLENALAQLQGQPATDASKGAFQLMTEFLDLLIDPSGGGGGGGTGNGGASGFAPTIRAGLPSDIAQA